jgi:lipopolysaccharide transport system permease protein
LSFPSEKQTLVIEAGRLQQRYWRDLWQYRELLYVLARRDIAVRYKQTAIGIAWAVVRPLATMLIFTLLFGRIANLPSEGAPYSLMVFTAMVPWFFFSSAVTETTNSLVGNSQLLAKVYFPRLVIPLSAIAVALVDFAISFGLLAVMMAWFGYTPSWRLMALPIFVLLAIVAALGLGLWFTALNVRYRDFRHVVPFVLQFGLFLSPVGFSSSVIPPAWRAIYAMNPIVGVIEGFRWAMLGGTFQIQADALISSTILSATLLATGLWYFRRTERSFADVI